MVTMMLRRPFFKGADKYTLTSENKDGSQTSFTFVADDEGHFHLDEIPPNIGIFATYISGECKPPTSH